VAVDLHTDPLKLEVVSTRHPFQLWAATETVAITGGVEVTGPTAELALLLALLHLNKDRFRSLLWYADVARIVRDPRLDWGRTMELADREGLRFMALATLGVVLDTLDLKFEVPARPGGIKSWLWDRLWSPSIRLRGAADLSHRHRQFWIAILADGGAGRALTGWTRRLFPPAALVSFYYPELNGPYFWKLAAGRFMRRRLLSRRVYSSPELDAGQSTGDAGASL
jgi:hypothetical protein